MRILHLEDDGPLREILAAALKATAPTCEILQFMNSDDALRYATENAQGVDLFILDVRVPGSMNGLQVAEKLRAIHCPGVIVITSAYRAPDEALLRRLSCEWYPKPWHLFEATTKLMTMAQRKPADQPVKPTPAAPVVAAAVPDVRSAPPAPSAPAAPADQPVEPTPTAPVAAATVPVMPPAPATPATPTDQPVEPKPAAPVAAATVPEVPPAPTTPAAPTDLPVKPTRAASAPTVPPPTPADTPAESDSGESGQG
jgi:CheY-like chemotaxis protein